MQYSQPQQPGGGNPAATMAHTAVNAQALYDLSRQRAAAAAQDQSPLQTGTTRNSVDGVSATANAANSSVTRAGSEAAKELQRQTILNHVNSLIQFCEIPQRNQNERITSVRQCSSSFFVLLCQRLFDATISGIDTYPNTAEKKRNNVELVLQELRNNGYPTDDISAEAVVQLDETHLSRLILLFVSIAQSRGMPAGGDSAGLPLPLATPSYTIAEVPASSASPPLTVSPAFDGGGMAVYGNPWLPQPPQQQLAAPQQQLPHMNHFGGEGDGVWHGTGDGIYSGLHPRYGNAMHPHEMAAMGESSEDYGPSEDVDGDADNATVDREVYVSQWRVDVAKAGQPRQQVKSTALPRSLEQSLQETKAQLLQQMAAANVHTPLLPSAARQEPSITGDRDSHPTSRPLTTPSESVPSVRGPAGVAVAEPRRARVSPQHVSVPPPPPQQQQQHGYPLQPRLRPLPLDEPPLTRAECRLLASHPNRLVDTTARDAKAERLRTQRFLGEAQSRLRQRLRAQYDRELSGLREELKTTQRQSRSAMLERKRQVREENQKYRDAYATVMEAAANAPRVPRRVMTRHTALVDAEYAAALRESRLMFERLQEESEQRNREELARYVMTVSDWQRRVPLQADY